jgi:hypothetical protein
MMIRLTRRNRDSTPWQTRMAKLGAEKKRSEHSKTPAVRVV